MLAVGEAHAPKGLESIPSAAKRFTAMLPLLEGQTKDLIVELLEPPEGCARANEKVEKATKEITERQAESNRGEYVEMGKRARAVGIRPDLLHPSCADFEAVSKPGDDSVLAMLPMIARLTTEQTRALVTGDGGAAKDGMVVLYGGAVHGDPEPPEHRASWSFAEGVAQLVSGRYVSLHLFVPEYIGRDPSWQQWAWYPHYDKAKHPHKVTLFHPRRDAYVLIFPSSS